MKTSILLFDNGLVKKTKEILFLKISNDGYDLGAQRREHDKNDLLISLTGNVGRVGLLPKEFLPAVLNQQAEWPKKI